MTLSECACVKPFQSSLGALGHNTPSLLTTVASGAAVNKPAHYYTRLTLCVSVFFLQYRDFFHYFSHKSRSVGVFYIFIYFYYEFRSTHH